MMLVPLLTALTAGLATGQAPAGPAGPTVHVGAHRGHHGGAGARQDFVVVNRTGHIVVDLRVSPNDSSQWGPDILDNATIGNGEEASVTFPSEVRQCSFDIQAVYEDHTNTEIRNVDLCTVATVTLTPD